MNFRKKKIGTPIQAFEVVGSLIPSLTIFYNINRIIKLYFEILSPNIHHL